MSIELSWENYDVGRTECERDQLQHALENEVKRTIIQKKWFKMTLLDYKEVLFFYNFIIIQCKQK